MPRRRRIGNAWEKAARFRYLAGPASFFVRAKPQKSHAALQTLVTEISQTAGMEKPGKRQLRASDSPQENEECAWPPSSSVAGQCLKKVKCFRNLHKRAAPQDPSSGVKVPLKASFLPAGAEGCNTPRAWGRVLQGWS